MGNGHENIPIHTSCNKIHLLLTLRMRRKMFTFLDHIFELLSIFTWWSSLGRPTDEQKSSNIWSRKVFKKLRTPDVNSTPKHLSNLTRFSFQKRQIRYEICRFCKWRFSRRISTQIVRCGYLKVSSQLAYERGKLFRCIGSHREGLWTQENRLLGVKIWKFSISKTCHFWKVSNLWFQKMLLSWEYIHPNCTV